MDDGIKMLTTVEILWNSIFPKCDLWSPALKLLKVLNTRVPQNLCLWGRFQNSESFSLSFSVCVGGEGVHARTRAHMWKRGIISQCIHGGQRTPLVFKPPTCVEHDLSMDCCCLHQASWPVCFYGCSYSWIRSHYDRNTGILGRLP